MPDIAVDSMMWSRLASEIILRYVMAVESACANYVRHRPAAIQRPGSVSIARA